MTPTESNPAQPTVDVPVEMPAKDHTSVEVPVEPAAPATEVETTVTTTVE